MPETVQKSIRFRNHDKIKELAEKHGMTFAAYVNYVLHHHLIEQDKIGHRK